MMLMLTLIGKIFKSEVVVVVMVFGCLRFKLALYVKFDRVHRFHWHGDSRDQPNDLCWRR